LELRRRLGRHAVVERRTPTVAPHHGMGGITVYWRYPALAGGGQASNWWSLHHDTATVPGLSCLSIRRRPCGVETSLRADVPACHPALWGRGDRDQKDVFVCCRRWPSGAGIFAGWIRACVFMCQTEWGEPSAYCMLGSVCTVARLWPGDMVLVKWCIAVKLRTGSEAMDDVPL
jgi:hypothetical protein